MNGELQKTHQKRDEGRDGPADPGAHAGDADGRVPHHGGEHLRGVIIDHGEGAGDEELAGDDDERVERREEGGVGGDDGGGGARKAPQHHEAAHQAAAAHDVHGPAGQRVAGDLHDAHQEQHQVRVALHGAGVHGQTVVHQAVGEPDHQSSHSLPLKPLSL